MKNFCYTALLFFISMSTLYCGQKQLMTAKAAELRALNKLVLQTIKNPAKLNGKKIYVKIRILPGDDKQLKFKVEKISVTKLKKAVKHDKKTLYLKGEIKKDNKNCYTVDLSDVLPPPTAKKAHETVKTTKTTKKEK